MEDIDAEIDDIKGEEISILRKDNIEEENRSQNGNSYFVPALAVKMYISMGKNIRRVT